METRNILCFGDSNTFGSVPRMFETELPSERYDENTRWPCVMRGDLGPGWKVIEEGLGGRCTIHPFADPALAYRVGEPYLLPCLLSHRPLDLVILMLGTNDLLTLMPPDEAHLGLGIRRLIEIVRATPKCGAGFAPPKILVLSPISVERSHPQGRTGVYAKFHGDLGHELSLKFPAVYAQIAAETGCAFLEAGKYASAGCDGIHFTAQAHIRLGHAAAEKVREIFS